MDNGLAGLIGLARKAGKVEAGEEPVSIAARTHKARLILLAADAADNTRRRGDSLSQTGNCPALTLPLTKTELGGAVGRESCAVLALTDVGLAAAVTKKLTTLDAATYGETAEHLERKAQKALRRKREKSASSQEKKPS